jgi:hypothetical protein
LKFENLFDLDEARKTNILLSGANASGKTRLACAVASMLHSLGYTVIVIDVSGVWKKISDLPYYTKPYKFNDEIELADFEQKMKLKATLPDEFFSFYNGSIVRTFLDSGVSDIVSVRDPRIEKIGSERRLSDKEVQELIKNKTLIYDENPVEGLVLNL